MSVGRDDDRDAGLDRKADVLVFQVKPIREAIRLQGRIGLRARVEQALEVDGVRGPAVDQPPGGMADRRHMRVLNGGKGPRGELILRPSLTGVDARHHPVELGEDDVR
jgi:hypothetical protein